jgi:hypothetical protein
LDFNGGSVCIGRAGKDHEVTTQGLILATTALRVAIRNLVTEPKRSKAGLECFAIVTATLCPILPTLRTG